MIFIIKLGEYLVAQWFKCWTAKPEAGVQFYHQFLSMFFPTPFRQIKLGKFSYFVDFASFGSRFLKTFLSFDSTYCG